MPQDKNAQGKKHHYPKQRWRAKASTAPVQDTPDPFQVPSKKSKKLHPSKVRKTPSNAKPPTDATEEFNVQVKRPVMMAESRNPNEDAVSGKDKVIEAVIRADNGSYAVPTAESEPLPVATEKPVLDLETPQKKNLFTKENAKEMRARRKNYGQKLPPVVCDNCAFSQQCPQFKQGFECAFMEMINGTSIDTPDDIIEAQKRIIEANLTTAELGLIQQRLSGGIIDDKTSSRLDAAFEQLAEMRRLAIEKTKAPLEKLEISGPGIIERLFGGLAAAATPKFANQNQNQLIDVVPQVIETIPEPSLEEVAEERRTEKEKELDEALGKFAADV